MSVITPLCIQMLMNVQSIRVDASSGARTQQAPSTATASQALVLLLMEDLALVSGSAKC